MRAHTHTLTGCICGLCCFAAHQAYDQHLNMILGDVEETVTTVEIDEETYEELYKVSTSLVLPYDWLIHMES